MGLCGLSLGGVLALEYTVRHPEKMDLNFRDSLETVSCPTLAVCGEKDRTNRKAAVELAERLPAGELRIIEGAGHEVNTEAPEALAEVLRAFWN